MSREAAYLREVAALALESKTLHEFHHELVERTIRALGAIGGTALTRLADGTGDVVNSMVDGREFARAFALNAGELTDDEHKRCLVKRAITSEEVHSSARRDQLSFYRDYLKRHSADKSIFRYWVGDESIHFIGFPALPVGNFQRYSAHACRLLDAVYPIVALAEKMHNRREPADGKILRSVSLEYKLTTCEHQTMNLMSRGLTNWSDPAVADSWLSEYQAATAPFCRS